MVHKVFHNTVSSDSVETLETLLAGARLGQVTGIAFVAILKRGRYMTAWTGSVDKNLTHALGGVTILSQELGNLIRNHRDPEETR